MLLNLTLAPPTIITPPTDVLQYEGLSVTFQCVAFSKPLYTVTWLLNNEVIIDDSEVNEVNETMLVHCSHVLRVKDTLRRGQPLSMMQWYLSILDTIGTAQSVLIKEMS